MEVQYEKIFCSIGRFINWFCVVHWPLVIFFPMCVILFGGNLCYPDIHLFDEYCSESCICSWFYSAIAFGYLIFVSFYEFFLFSAWVDSRRARNNKKTDQPED